MVDKIKIEEAIRLLLEGMGEDPQREGLLQTPARVSRLYEEILGGRDEDPETHLSKQFSVGKNEMIVETDISFYSMCEHHILPFFGKAHIGYIPGEKVVGLSKLARTVELYARRLQLQESLTWQIAEALEKGLKPVGVLVMLEAEHTCMTMRGVKKPGSKTTTMVARGAFKENPKLQETFMQIVKG